MCSAIKGDLDQRYRQNGIACRTRKGINFQRRQPISFQSLFLCVVIIIGNGGDRDDDRQWQLSSGVYGLQKEMEEVTQSDALVRSLFMHFTLDSSE